MDRLQDGFRFRFWYQDVCVPIIYRYVHGSGKPERMKERQTAYNRFTSVIKSMEPSPALLDITGKI